MNMIDYLLLAAVATAALYTVFRLFLGWLRTPGHQTASEEWPNSSRASAEPPVHFGSTTRAPWLPRDHSRRALPSMKTSMPMMTKSH
jgi:hypothetical protein